MTYWYHTYDSGLPDDVAEFGLPIEVHGNWWWQPSGALTTYPLPDGLGMPIHISDVVAAGSGDAEACERLCQSWWEWTHEYPALGSLMEEQIPYQAAQMQTRLNAAISTMLSQWVDSGQRETYWRILKETGTSEEAGLQALLRAMQAAPSGLRNAVHAIVESPKFLAFARALVEEELHITFPGILNTHPDTVNEQPGTEDNGLECLPFAIDLSCILSYAEATWRGHGAAVEEPLEDKRLFERIHQWIDEKYNISGVSSALAAGRYADALAAAVMSHIDQRPREERYALCIDQLPIHLLTGDKGMALMQRAVKKSQEHLDTGEEKGTTLGYVDAGGRIYVRDPVQIKSKLAYHPNALRRLRGDTGIVEKGTAERWFHDALDEELTHRVQIGPRFPAMHFTPDGMHALFTGELGNVGAVPEKPASHYFACKNMKKRLGELKDELHFYAKRHDRNVRLGVYPPGGKEAHLDREAYAKFHDIWTGCTEVEQEAIALMLPMTTAYFHEMQERVHGMLPEIREEKRRADRTVAEWLIASASEDADNGTQIIRYGTHP